MSRVQILLDAVAAMLSAAVTSDCKIFADVRVQLDPYDLEDVTRESFRSPAARVLFTVGKPIPKATGGLDLECTVSIAIISSRSGRADPTVASADAKALDLALMVSQLIADDPYFGLGRMTAAQIEGFKVAVSEKANERGLAITLVMFKATLLDVVIERPIIAAAAETGRNPWLPDQLAINNGEVEP